MVDSALIGSVALQYNHTKTLHFRCILLQILNVGRDLGQKQNSLDVFQLISGITFQQLNSPGLLEKFYCSWSWNRIQDPNIMQDRIGHEG